MEKYLLCFAILATFGCNSVIAEFTCKTVGTFADPEDTSCQKYYICSVLSDGTYVTTSATCTSSKKFDKTLKACSDAYVCNSNSSTSTTVASTVIDFQCISTGRFENPNDFSCTTYYLCSNYYGTFIKTLYKCPLSAYFDPDLHRCTTHHVCAAATTTTTAATTTITTVASTVADLECTKTGRFENPNDLSCTTYYLCSKYYGTFIKTLYKCPVSAYFDPDLKRCTTKYVCATAATTTTTTTAPTTTTNFDEITTEAEMVTLVTTESAYDHFVCTARGRYANFRDSTCKEYYLCNHLRNGTYLQTAYNCPSNSVFDQSIYKCTTLQDCNAIRNSAFVVTSQFSD